MGKFFNVAGLVVALTGANCAAAETGFYGGVLLGYIEADDVSVPLDDGSNFSGTTIDDASATVSVYGGYRANTYLSIELGYMDFGELWLATFSDGTGSVWSSGRVLFTANATGVNLGLKGYLPVQNNFYLYGKVGITRWNIDYIISNGGISNSSENDGIDPYFGIGASFSLKRFNFNLELSQYEVDGGDLDSVSTGVEFRF